MAVNDARTEASAVETRTLLQGPTLSGDPNAILLTVRRCLISASDEGVLTNSIARILSLVKRRDAGPVMEILGGATFDKGQETDEFFVRNDGARISFAVTVIGRGPSLSIPAYRFHLRFPAGMIPPYVRFDLNPERGDPLLEPRCHVHVGADDVRVATPFMTPVEILTKLLYGLPCDSRIPRVSE